MVETGAHFATRGTPQATAPLSLEETKEQLNSIDPLKEIEKQARSRFQGQRRMAWAVSGLARPPVLAD